jgi:hypothetical protein
MQFVRVTVNLIQNNLTIHDLLFHLFTYRWNLNLQTCNSRHFLLVDEVVACGTKPVLCVRTQ